MAISTRFDLPKAVSRLLCFVFLVAVSLPAAAQTTPAFYFRSFVGKCLDHGTEPTVSAVFLSDCKGTATERIVVQEIPITHSVVLRAGTKCIGTVANAVLRNIPLQVQDCGGVPKKGPIWGWEPIAQVFRMPVAVLDRTKKKVFALMIDNHRISTHAVGNIPPLLFEIVFVIDVQRIAVGFLGVRSRDN